MLALLPWLEEPFELELAALDAAVQQPVTAEHPVLVGRTRDVRVRAARGTRKESDRFEARLQTRARKDRRAEQPFGEHARGVVREDGNRVRPQWRVDAVARDEALVESLDERIARIELIDPDPTLELVEAH